MRDWDDSDWVIYGYIAFCFAVLLSPLVVLLILWVFR